ncbi:hypothetical protein SAMN04488526_0860 [Jannaschia helgolandensis]|uniref:Uncharacterized protein n=1 Tax=Jannaschia helgolandensis TaxID=188906 RepID=A0A1H7HY86_9RHOB|nr:hypothetical protein SAMN04488526_0860 [Jannaschia helgolandensis]
MIARLTAFALLAATPAAAQDAMTVVLDWFVNPDHEGISEAELFAAREASQNLAYTRYVLDAGHSGDFLDLMADP